MCTNKIHLGRRKLKRLGTVIDIIDTLLIVRADRTLEKGALFQNSIVITKKMKKIGRIKEVFGPVDTPYFSIRIFNDITKSEISNMKNERVYVQQ